MAKLECLSYFSLFRADVYFSNNTENVFVNFLILFVNVLISNLFRVKKIFTGGNVSKME